MPLTRFRLRVPLAWSNLMHSKAKLAGSLAGITFAVALMFMEMGFENALLDGMVALVQKLDAQLLMVSRSSYSLGFKNPFSRRHLYEAGRFEGVEWVSPLYVESNLSRWRQPVTGHRRSIRVVAFSPTDAIFLDRAITSQVEALRQPRSALFDSGGKWWNYRGPEDRRPLWERFTLAYGGPRAGESGELMGGEVRIVGQFELGADLLNAGTLLMSDRNYLSYFADRGLASPELLPVDLGLIRVDPHIAEDRARLRDLRARIQATLPDSVRVYTKGELIDEEQGFWLHNTPVGFIFRLGMFMGFIVGMVICYQILSSDISSYLREYATLMAMGYNRGYLVRVLLQEAVYLALLSFACGSGVAFVFYKSLEQYTRMPFLLDGWRLAGILLVTLAMCVGSACLAAHKLWKAAPADLF